MGGDSGYAIDPGADAELGYSAINGSVPEQVLDSIAKSGDYRIIIMTSKGIAAYEGGKNRAQCG